MLVQQQQTYTVSLEANALDTRMKGRAIERLCDTVLGKPNGNSMVVAIVPDSTRFLHSELCADSGRVYADVVVETVSVVLTPTQEERAWVSDLNNLGLHCSMDGVTVFVSRDQLGSHWDFMTTDGVECFENSVTGGKICKDMTVSIRVLAHRIWNGSLFGVGQLVDTRKRKKNDDI